MIIQTRVLLSGLTGVSVLHADGRPSITTVVIGPSNPGVEVDALVSADSVLSTPEVVVEGALVHPPPALEVKSSHPGKGASSPTGQLLQETIIKQIVDRSQGGSQTIAISRSTGPGSASAHIQIAATLVSDPTSRTSKEATFH